MVSVTHEQGMGYKFPLNRCGPTSSANQLCQLCQHCGPWGLSPPKPHCHASPAHKARGAEWRDSKGCTYTTAFIWMFHNYICQLQQKISVLHVSQWTFDDYVFILAQRPHFWCFLFLLLCLMAHLVHHGLSLSSRSGLLPFRLSSLRCPKIKPKTPFSLPFKITFLSLEIISFVLASFLEVLFGKQKAAYRVWFRRTFLWSVMVL